ncbi:hypothetical protein GUJ93_ZPchr0011g27754 [Zizania palustris]|uniref:Uncharacterized protein n=1 Tax=Zizania palustris TaxID=103762 RepID=A0A8J5WMP5_ZIZPA|nr:hypothetical protein GUJ93_ZPchr0011g27754 [Zizania palustris]
MPLRVLELPSPTPQPPLLQPPAAEPRSKGLQNSWFSPLKLLGCSGGRMEARAQRAQRVFVCKKAVESTKADNGFEGFQMSIFEDVLSQARSCPGPSCSDELGAIAAAAATWRCRNRGSTAAAGALLSDMSEGNDEERRQEAMKMEVVVETIETWTS